MIERLGQANDERVVSRDYLARLEKEAADLRVALASQIEITNTERGKAEALAKDVMRLRGLALEALAHIEQRPMSMCAMTPDRLRERLRTEGTSAGTSEKK